MALRGSWCGGNNNSLLFLLVVTMTMMVVKVDASTTTFVPGVGMILTGIFYPFNSSIPNKDTLRDRGDLLNPSSPGSNAIRCGFAVTTRPSPKRLSVARGEPFKIRGRIYNPLPGSQLSFRILYGESPNFVDSRGNYLLPARDYIVEVNKSLDVFDWVVTRAISPAYNYRATIQVQYTYNATFSLFQCIDFNVTGGIPFPEGKTQAGFDDTTVSPLDVRYQITPTTNPFSRVLLALLIVLLVALAILITCICYLRWLHKKNTRPREQFQHIDEPAPINDPDIHDERKKLEIEEEKKEEESEEEEIEVVDGAGTGRTFHFIYVDR